MSIQVDRSGRRFLLAAKDMSYAFELGETDLPINLYWGRKLERAEDLPAIRELQCYRHRASWLQQAARQEYPAFFGEFYQECSLKVTYPDGVRGTRFVFKGGTVTEADDHDLLTLSFIDAIHPLKLRLYYRVWHDIELIDRWSEIENGLDTEVNLERYDSACWQFPATVVDWRLTQLSGRWGKEAMPARLPVTQGKFVMESRTGLSGPYNVPFFALDDGTATELAGEVFFGTLQWSGNWQIAVERNSFEETCVTGGINPFDNLLVLKPGECFTTPVFSGVHYQR